MSTKVFSSPGLSAKPLSPWERWREYSRSIRYSYPYNDWWKLKYWFHETFWTLRHPIRSYRNRKFWRHASKTLLQALEGGSYTPGELSTAGPLQVESLEATMQVVTFDDRKLRL